MPRIVVVILICYRHNCRTYKRVIMLVDFNVSDHGLMACQFPSSYCYGKFEGNSIRAATCILGLD
jgi:hypothetical protein